MCYTLKLLKRFTYVIGVAGWMPLKIRQELIWNRTINYSGGQGRNIPSDLMNEFFNRIFKGMLIYFIICQTE